MRDDQEDVVAMDAERGPLVCRVVKGAQQIRLALRQLDTGTTFKFVYRTYDRSAERDADGRPIYRAGMS